MEKLLLLPFQDVYISEWYKDINFAGNNALFVSQYKQYQDDYRSLLQFELEPISPAKIIEKAVLELTMYRNETGEPTIISAHRLLQGWCQSAVTWDTQPTFSMVPDGSVTITEEDKAGKIFINLTELVKAWHNGSVPNQGLLLMGNEQANALVAFHGTNYNERNTWPLLHVSCIDEDNLEQEELIIPEYPPYAPLEASTPIPLSPKNKATFLVKNASASCNVQAIIQIGYSNKPNETFFNSGCWMDLKPEGYPGEAVALTTTDIAEYARVLIKGDGGETVYVWSRTR